MARSSTSPTALAVRACHGGAEKWIESHTMKTSSYADNLTNGMYPTATLANRAPLCLVMPRGQFGQVHYSPHHGCGPPTTELRASTRSRRCSLRITSSTRTTPRVKPRCTAVRLCGRSGRSRPRACRCSSSNSILRRTERRFPSSSLFSCHFCHQSSMHQLDWARGSRRSVRSLAVFR